MIKNAHILSALQDHAPAIGEELSKEAMLGAAIGKGLATIGKTVARGATRAVGGVSPSAGKSMVGAYRKAGKRFGQTRLRQGIGAATVGAGALGAAALK